MIIEHADIRDAAEILALQKLAYQSEASIYDDYDIPPLTQTLAEMEAEFETAGRVVLKATLDGRIVGSVRAHEAQGTCHVGRLIVHPDHQNRGTGTALLQRIEAAFPWAARFELFTGHLSVRNLYLYRKQGYVEFKRQRMSDAIEIVFLQKLTSAA